MTGERHRDDRLRSDAVGSLALAVGPPPDSVELLRSAADPFIGCARARTLGRRACICTPPRRRVVALRARGRRAPVTAPFVHRVDVRRGEVARWGNTSFDVLFTGTVAGRPVFTNTITDVGVNLGTDETMPPPDDIKALLGS